MRPPELRAAGRAAEAVVRRLREGGGEWSGEPDEEVRTASWLHCRCRKDGGERGSEPVKYPAGPKVGGWVARKRECKKRLDAGHPTSGTTVERVAKRSGSTGLC